MLPAQGTAIYPELFQPWQPTANGDDQNQTTVYPSDYIELPAVNNYEELQSHDDFPDIQFRFLRDIEELRRLAHTYVDHQYDAAMGAFLNTMDTPPVYLQGNLLPLYRETRFQIHQLVRELHEEQNFRNADNSTDHQAYIASVLHDCLNGIEQCPAGIHSRFNQSFLNLQACRAGLQGKLFKVRQELFREFIGSFLVQQQREGLIEIPGAMEVHWFNSLYNLYCEHLALPPSDDPIAITHLSDGLICRFLLAAPLSVNACIVLRKIATQWSDELRATLEQLGVSAWERVAIEPGELTPEIAGVLDSKLFKPMNHLLRTTEDQSFDLWTVLEESPDGRYRLDRYREKLLAQVTRYFCGSSVTVFTSIPGEDNRHTYIGTMNGLFFWVFAHDHFLHGDQVCTFEAGNHTTLQLPHLITIDFSTWPENTCHALLTQAMEQTHKARDIASFFLHPSIREQLGKIPKPVIQILANQLTDKLAHNGNTFKEKLCQCIRDHFACSSKIATSVAQLRWLIDTPLLEPVLSELRQHRMDISTITKRLASWQISDFSEAGLSSLLTSADCRRLFRQALARNQGQVMAHLLLTGHCDQCPELLNNNQKSPLRLFARQGILPGVKYILQRSAPGILVNGKDSRGLSPLHCAAKFGHPDCITALLNAPGILVNEKDNDGLTPLHFATKSGHPGCVTVLLNAPGILVNEKDSDSLTPLHFATEFGHPGCVTALLNAPGLLVNEKDNDGLTPMLCAVQFSHPECVTALLNAPGLLINEKNSEGLTPLHCAAQFGQPDCITALLNAPDLLVNEKNSEGFTPLHCAAQFGHQECVTALLNAPDLLVNEKNNDGFTPMHCAAQFGHPDCVTALLDAADIQVNNRDADYGHTPLHLAAFWGKLDCITALLKAPEIKVNPKDNNGFTPLDCAADGGHPDCVKLLLNAPGMKINERNTSGATPLHSVIRYGYSSCVTALLNLPGIQVNKTDYLGFTPLNYAARAGDPDCVLALLQAPDIQINKKNSEGFTPLNNAARAGHTDCVKLLLNTRGIQVNEKNKVGWSPLHNAARYGYVDCVSALLNAPDIKVNEKTKYNSHSPLHYAAKYGHIDCVTALLQAPNIKIDKRSLMAAIRNEHQECAKLLIRHAQKNVNSIGLLMMTVLTKAGNKEITEIINLLQAEQRLSTSNTSLDRFTMMF